MDDSPFLVLNLPIQIDSLFNEEITDSEKEVIANIGNMHFLA